MNEKQRTAINRFLLGMLVIIFIQVAIGGITRLTDSGLSMTDWKPIMGSIPPLNAAEWEVAFEQYKQIPQYDIVNKGMNISEFKAIFFWEYLHRMWGRVGFLVILVGLAFFVVKRYLDFKWLSRFIILILLYAAQGVLGWIMVKSGLSENIRVSHYRLTAHLMLAIAIFSYVAWLFSELVTLPQYHITNRLKPYYSWGLVLIVLLIIQIVYGGFMAGMRAAIHYASWPLMNGKWIPDNLFFMKPFIKNFGENIATIQFIHRGLAYLLFFALLQYWFKLKDKMKHSLVNALPVLLVAQVVLGIATLLAAKGGEISIIWGVLHQINGLLLFTNFLFIWFLMRKNISV